LRAKLFCLFDEYKNKALLDFDLEIAKCPQYSESYVLKANILASKGLLVDDHLDKTIDLGIKSLCSPCCFNDKQLKSK
jgi:hypothetical protein